MQEWKTRLNEERSPTHAFGGWTKQIITLSQGIFVFLERNTLFGTLEAFETFCFNWTDEGLCWPLSVRCRQRDFDPDPVFHPQEKNCIIICSSSIYPWGVCLSRMPTKPWIKLRNLEETCKLKLAQSHLLLLFIYLVWDDSHIHLPYGIKSFGSLSYYYMIQRV